MMPRHRLPVAFLSGLALWCALAVPGCASRRQGDVTFHDPNMDFSLVERAAVLPFANLTTNQVAGERVRDVFMTMLQATGSVYVLPPGEVARGIARARVANPAQPTPEEIVSLAKEVGANAVIAGTVREYGEVRSGNANANVVAVSLQMFEAESGRLIWGASSSKGGITTKDRLLGTGGQPMNDVTEQAVQDLLDKLFQ